MIVATIIENISIDTIFAKNLPRETRAILNGVYSFSGSLGILIYSLVGGWLFDTYGPRSPFVLIGILDFLYGFYILIRAKSIFQKHEEIDLRHSQKSKPIIGGTPIQAVDMANSQTENIN